MAMQVPFPVRFEDVFPHGAFALDVSAVEDFDKPQGTDRQTRDKTTGDRVWSVRVLDADPESRKGQAELAVKIAAEVKPVPPETLPGLPFGPVEFDGMTVTPYVDERGKRPKVAYSLRAKAMRAPMGNAAAAGKPQAA
jgi:hypothetical protein